MYNLRQAGKNTYYITGPNKVGLYIYDGDSAFLIDAGNSETEGRKIYEIIKDNGWNLKGIVNTHSHADHIGGNPFLQEKTGCMVINNEIENTFTLYPVLEPAFMYGAYPPKRLQKKFLMAEPSKTTTDLSLLPKGLTTFSLPGHWLNMMGVKTDDGVYFVADSLFPEHVLKTIHIGTIYDCGKFYETLDYLDSLQGPGRFFVPTHAEEGSDISRIIDLNRKELDSIIEYILKICKRPLALNMITKKAIDHYDIQLNYIQYNLICGTLKAIISYLIAEKKLEIIFQQNFVLYGTRR